MDYRERIERVLERVLDLPDTGSTRLRDAMRYAALGARANPAGRPAG